MCSPEAEDKPKQFIRDINNYHIPTDKQKLYKYLLDCLALIDIWGKRKDLEYYDKIMVAFRNKYDSALTIAKLHFPNDLNFTRFYDSTDSDILPTDSQKTEIKRTIGDEIKRAIGQKEKLEAIGFYQIPEEKDELRKFITQVESCCDTYKKMNYGNDEDNSDLYDALKKKLNQAEMLALSFFPDEPMSIEIAKKHNRRKKLNKIRNIFIGIVAFILLLVLLVVFNELG